jgi:HPt (histidine-containing phosphotransfer) domain-containing protein
MTLLPSDLFEADPVLNRAGGIDTLAAEIVSMSCLDLRKREAEFLEALQRGDYPAARESIHSVRGLAGLAGFARLEAEARDWEERLAEGARPSLEEAEEALRALVDQSIEAGLKFAKGF